MSWGLEDLAQLFAPGKRHEKEERERMKHARVQDEAGAPPATRVDLDAGVVYLRAPRQSGATD